MLRESCGVKPRWITRVTTWGESENLAIAIPNAANANTEGDIGKISNFDIVAYEYFYPTSISPKTPKKRYLTSKGLKLTRIRALEQTPHFTRSNTCAF